MNGAPPLVSDIARPWWDALARDTVALQHCTGCAGWVFYPRPFCPHCGGRTLAWRRVDATATLYSWTVAEVAVSSHFTHLRRPILAVVRLDIGIHLPTTLVDVAHDAVRIGMALQPVFDHASYENATVLRYRPDATAALARIRQTTQVSSARLAENQSGTIPAPVRSRQPGRLARNDPDGLASSGTTERTPE